VTWVEFELLHLANEGMVLERLIYNSLRPCSPTGEHGLRWLFCFFPNNGKTVLVISRYLVIKPIMIVELEGEKIEVLELS